MLRHLSALAMFAPVAFGQFTEMAATDDGRRLFFTSGLRQRAASEQPAESRVFRLDGAALALYSERGGLACRNQSSNSDGASSLHVSGDGESVAVVQSGICPSGGYDSSSSVRAAVQGRYARTFDDAAQILLSRNGRWALVTSRASTASSTLVNLETGERQEVGRAATSDGYFALASDGSVLLRAAGADGRLQLGVWRGGQLQPAPAMPAGLYAVLGLSDDASTIFVSRIELPAAGEPFPRTPSPELLALDMKAGTSRSLGRADGIGRWNLLGISNDGSRALFSGLGEPGVGIAFLADLRGRVLHPVRLAAGERPVAGAISGDGNSFFLGTTAARIVRCATRADGSPSPDLEELLPATPYIPELEIGTAPGLRLEITAPLPGDIDWRGRIRLNDRAVAILGRTRAGLDVQIPWELTTGRADLLVDYASASPLIQRDGPYVLPARVGFPALPEGARGLLGGRLIKGDFSGYVTDPLRPGDIIHFYMTGLGAVVGAVETGQPAPAADPRPLASALTCRFLPGPSAQTDTVFAGLAPGMIGIYQVTLRMPVDVPPTPSGLQCSYGNGSFSIVTVALSPQSDPVPLSAAALR